MFTNQPQSCGFRVVGLQANVSRFSSASYYVYLRSHQ